MGTETKNKMVSLDVIADELMKAKSIYIFPHYVPDGDAIGSSAAICKAMRKLGKDCIIVLEDHYPANIAFLDKDYCVWVQEDDDLPAPYLSLALDCSDTDRFPKRVKHFDSAARTACIDHHLTQGNYAMFNHVDSKASATCELVYTLLTDIMKLELDVEQAEAIYTGIVLDTGSFEYSNTSEKTHRITADLYKYGIDAAGINIRLHQNERIEKIKLHSLAMSQMELFCGGRAAIAWCTLKMLEETGADLTETDGINASLRNIEGVEIAVFLREKFEREIKCGFRSKFDINVASIAEHFDGGGHARAAGCTMYMPLTDTKKIIMNAVAKAIEEKDSAGINNNEFSA